MSLLKADDSDLVSLEESRQTLERTVRELKGSLSEIQGKVNREIAFKYDNPEPGFDRKRVFGMTYAIQESVSVNLLMSIQLGRVAELVTVTRPEMATALNVAAGGRLYNVVVDNEKVLPFDFYIHDTCAYVFDIDRLAFAEQGQARLFNDLYPSQSDPSQRSLPGSTSLKTNPNPCPYPLSLSLTTVSHSSLTLPTTLPFTLTLTPLNHSLFASLNLSLLG